MNSPETLDEKQLHWVTSRCLPVDAKLDDEHAWLREGWKNLGILLEASAKDRTPQVVPSTNSITNYRTVWPHYTTSLLSATLLVSLVTGWFVFQGNHTNHKRLVMPPTSNSEPSIRAIPFDIAHRTPPDSHTTSSLTTQAKFAKKYRGTKDPYAWEDSWDSEITLVEQAILEVGWSCNSFDPRLESVYEDIGKYKSEFDNTTL